MDTHKITLTFYNFCAVGLVFFAIFMSALVSRTVFERLPHLEDEMAYLFQARVFAHGEVVIDSPPNRQAFWQPFVVDYQDTGKRFSKYTPGWSALLAVGIALGQGWVVNAFLSGLTVAVIYRLGREVFNADVGLIAAALTAFSPMALLLNATLMGHTAALFFTMMFMYAYWRMERKGARYHLLWGALAGLMLGLLVVNRPLTAVGIVAPFIVWSAMRVLRGIFRYFRVGVGGASPLQTMTSLIALAVLAGIISTAVPAYNYLTTREPGKNLYTLVWPYDRIGFGECCGRNVHSLEKAIRHTRFDLSLTAADLYGWQLGTITPELQAHLQTEGNYWPVYGISWILLPLGMLIGTRRVWESIVWLAIGAVWWVVTTNYGSLQDPTFSWNWLIAMMIWAIGPLLFASEAKHWTWLLASVALCLILVHFTYWIGSQRYSTRYYYEMLGALALISALPLAWLARRRYLRWPVYGLLAAVLVYSLYAYSTPRINTLYRFNKVGQEMIAAVNERREADRPVLVLVTGEDVRWRAYGSLMASTSPFLDSEIVAARTTSDAMTAQLQAMFPDRQVIFLDANVNDAVFRDQN
jgi:4-amino-4-deoxy-L-arabinose transferase-like glycosyltransferase